MNDDRKLERDIASILFETAPSRAPDDLMADVITSASNERPMPRWLALIKEPPMRTSSGVAVGSPMARVAAIMIATLLLGVLVASAGVAGSQLLAADSTIVVAQDGSGDFVTIGDAVAAAVDGDTISVRPGTYVAALVIDKDITLMGDGPADEIVISAPEDGPTTSTGLLGAGGLTTDTHPYAILLIDTDSTLSGLTFRGSRSAVVASGGSPTLEGLRFDGPRVLEVFPNERWGESAMVINGGSTATVRGNTLFEGAYIAVFDFSDPMILENTLEGLGATIVGGFGDAAVVRANVIVGSAGSKVGRNASAAIGVYNPSTLMIAENRIIAVDDAGIWVGDPVLSGRGFDPVIRGNRISGAYIGVRVDAGAEPLVETNELVDNSIAIALTRSDAVLESNVITGGDAGIVIIGGAPVLETNTVEGSGRGISIAIGGASPSLIGNVVCGNTTNLYVSEGEEPPDTSGNEICADGVARTTE